MSTQIFLTKENKAALAKHPMMSQDGKGMFAEVAVKFFCPRNGWRWYITEADLDTGEAFGYVCGLDREWGYISLEELKENMGIVERDMYFDPKPLGEALTSDGYKL